MINEYKFTSSKGNIYLVKVSPDIAVRGGSKGKGTTTTLYKFADDTHTQVLPGSIGFQGPSSKAAIERILKTARWE